MNKYYNKKTKIDGYTFDSMKEANYYLELKLRKKAGDIKDFELQPEFLLQDKYKKNGKTIRAITYRADFKIIHNDNSIEIIDCKGMKTEVYKLKKKLFEYKYPYCIKEV